MIDEHALIQQAREGDEQAFAELYRLHASRILQYCRHHTYSLEDAEDVAQTTWANAWAAMHRYQDRGVPILHWLTLIAHHATTDLYRKKHPEGTRWTRPLPDNLNHECIADQSPRPDELAERNDTLRRQVPALHQAVASLKPDYRTVIAGRYYHDTPYPKLAESMRKTEVNVRVLQHRALQCLRSAMQRDIRRSR